MKLILDIIYLLSGIAGFIAYTITDDNDYFIIGLLFLIILNQENKYLNKIENYVFKKKEKKGKQKAILRKR